MNNMRTRELDSQQVEILGRNLLVTELVREGIEVALPVRDRGIDLIAYLDRAAMPAVPIQMKVASSQGFGIDGKYSKMPSLVIVHVWHVDGEGEPAFFSMTYPQALHVGGTKWLTSKSWKTECRYSTSQPSKALVERLRPFKVVRGGWRRAIFGRDTVDEERPHS